MVMGKVGFRFDILLLVVAVLGIVVGGVGLFYNDRLASRHDAWVAMTKQLQNDALAVNKVAEDVGRGLPPNYTLLIGQSEKFADAIRILHEGDDDAGIAPMPGAVREQVDAVEQAWAKMRKSLDTLDASEEAVGAVGKQLGSIEDNGVKVFGLYQDVSQRLVLGGVVERLAPASAQMGRVVHIRILSRRLLGDGRDAGHIAGKLGTEAAELLEVQQSLEGDGPVGQYVREQRPLVERLAASARALAELGPALNQMQVAAAVLPGEGRNLYSHAIALEDGLAPLAGSGNFLYLTILPALGIAILALVGYVVVRVLEVRGRVRRAEQNDQKQQAAILALLDEINTLADGDLTVRANVTGAFTDAIADSINYTVDTLRNLVGTINQTAVEISAAATSTQETAGFMQAASESQASEVVEIAARMKQSSESLDTVAQRAEQLSRQATTSVDVAHKGASTVGRTILGMAALREQIQDTSKRIKRLGESSQEIGTIIEFINDIAEQTNTLALNASIQAAMAGESGRGFAIVADQVQSLAERAASATRQIETLVKTIQADTNEAIVSMERSTSNVVAGARSAEEAGQALTRIEATSTDLARLIQEISSETRSEAAVAGRLAGQIQSIREIAFQTAGSAQKTAEAVGELNSLSTTLRESVAGFRLPADVSLDTSMVSAFAEPAAST